MLKAVFYSLLMAGGIGATFANPLYGAVTCILAYLLNPQVIVGDFLDVRFQLYVTIAFFISLFIQRNKRQGGLAGAVWPIVLLWLFVAIGAMSATWAVVSPQQSIEQISELAKTVLMVTGLVIVVQTERDLKVIVTACIIGAWHAALMHTFGVKWGYVSQSFGKEIGILPDGQTPVMILLLPLTAVTAMMGATRKERLLSWCALPFLLNSIVSTYQRTGFVSLAVEIVAMLFFFPKRLFLRVLPVLIAGGALFVFRLTPEDYWSKMKTIRTPTEEASANSRFIINSASWRILADYPMGVGYRNYPDVSPRYLPPELLTDGRRSAHDSYLSIACETGVLGFAVWIAAFAGALLFCNRIRRHIDFAALNSIGTYALATQVGLLGWLAGGFFQADHEVDPAYWLVAFAVILTRLQRAREADAGDIGCKEADAGVPATVI